MLLYGKSHIQGSYLCPPVPATYQILPSTLSAKEDPCQCERSVEICFQPAENSCYGNTVRAKSEKYWTPGVHQVFVKTELASSQDFLCHWKNSIRSSRYTDFIHVRIKLTIPWVLLHIQAISEAFYFVNVNDWWKTWVIFVQQPVPYFRSYFTDLFPCSQWSF